MEAHIKELELALANTKLASDLSSRNLSGDFNLSFSNDQFSSFFPQMPSLSTSTYSVQPHFQNLVNTNPSFGISNPDNPFSPEIILDMLEGFFNNCNWWPVNFIHPQSFISKRYYVNPALLYAVCARGSKFSKYEPMLKATGLNVPEILFQAAKRNFDHEEMSLESLMAAIHLCFFNLTHGRLRQSLMYLNIISNLTKFLHLYIDPDDLEQRFGVRWSVIEKETRRRIWLSVYPVLSKITGQLSEYSQLFSKNFSVKKPLPLKTFHALSEVTIDLNLHNQNVFFMNDLEYDTESIAQELLSMIDGIEAFLDRNFCKEITDATYLEADLINNNLTTWFESKPIWFKTALESENFDSTTMAEPVVLYLSILIMLMYHAARILIYRFVISSLCRYPPSLHQLNTESPQSTNMALRSCWFSHRFILKALKSCTALSESYQLQRYYFITPVLAQTAVFCCTMLKFADVMEYRAEALRDYKYLKRRIMSTVPFIHSIPKYMLQDLEKLETISHGEIRERETFQIFRYDLTYFESKVFAEEMMSKNQNKETIANSPIGYFNSLTVGVGKNPVEESSPYQESENSALEISGSTRVSLTNEESQDLIFDSIFEFDMDSGA
ncbi:hypothetical protein HK096_007039 [Nowakowskiella sp. JEL0078]|nr:hypothetical protein HK096_007039 [Nowakowskiella sp. JEL0078]